MNLTRMWHDRTLEIAGVKEAASPARMLFSEPAQIAFALPAVAAATMGAYNDGVAYRDGAISPQYLPAALAGGTAAAGLGMLAASPFLRRALAGPASYVGRRAGQYFDSLADTLPDIAEVAPHVGTLRDTADLMRAQMPALVQRAGVGAAGMVAAPVLYAGGSALGVAHAEENDPSLATRIARTFGAQRGYDRFSF